MASPCEILMDIDDPELAKQLLAEASAEAWRIEQKLSRYRSDNLIYQINHANGKAIKVDDEIANLLDYAQQCYQISDGLFDITSGILREAWHFDCGNNIPSQQTVDKLLNRIGWNKISWKRPYIKLNKGMQIDLGGIGKEYAVDNTVQRLKQLTDASLLINFGGDLHSTSVRHNGEPWSVGVEEVEPTNIITKILQIKKGAMATSGDSRRFLMRDGVRYGHILNPHTGWPALGTPHSITVVAASCTEAGILATLAMLQGSQAELFLKEQQVQYWCNHQ